MKRFLCFIIALLMLSSFVCTIVSAEESTPTPRFNNILNADATFVISNGIATIEFYYSGYQGQTTYANVTILLEKRRLLVFWKDVEEWHITSTNAVDSFIRSCNVEGGTYRATVTYEIGGTLGAADTGEIEREYVYED